LFIRDSLSFAGNLDFHPAANRSPTGLQQTIISIFFGKI
jgi:hypothetical protein